MRLRRCVLASVLSASALLLLPAAGRAQSQEDKAAAEALFDEARRLVKEGKLDQACPKFAESQRLDAGVGTLLHLADCWERQGKTASAWSAFREAAGMARAAGQPDRMKVAEQRAAALDTKLSRLTVTLAPGADVPGLVVLRDGVRIAPALLGTAIPVDPGKRVLRVEAPNHKAWETTVDVVPPGTTVTITPLQRDEAAPPATTTSTRPSPPTASSHTTSTAAPGEGAEQHPHRTTGFVVLAASGVALGAGAYFGMRAFSTYSDRKENCNAANVCNPRGVALTDDARSQARFSTVFFAVGVVGAAAGAYLAFGPTKQTRVGAAVAPGSAAIVLGGSL